MEIPPCITIFDRLPRSASSLSFSELESNESFLLARHDVVLLPECLGVSQCVSVWCGNSVTLYKQ